MNQSLPTRDPAMRAVDLPALLSMLRRRWPVMVAIAAGVALACVAVSLLLPPRYEAVARLRISPRTQTGLEAGQQPPGQPDNQVVDSEVSVMRSRDLAEAVARRLDLARQPAFNPALAASIAPEGRSKGPVPDAVVRAVQAGLTVRREPDTYLAQIIYRARDPVQAASIANAFAEAYLDASVERRTGAAGRQSRQLDARLAQLGAEVEAAEARVAAFRAGAGIVSRGAAGTVTDQQVAPLSAQLATAEANAAALRARAAAARAQSATGGPEGVSEVLGSGVVADLRRQRAEVGREQAQISARYGPKHPETSRVADQIAGLDRQIDAESRRIVAGLEADAGAAAASAASLRAQLDALRTAQASDARAAVSADRLQRDADAKRTVYAQLAQAAQQSSQEQRTSEPQGALVERAVPPSRPAFPKRLLFALFGVGLGLLLGFGIVLAREVASSGVRTAEEMERSLDLPFLAALPRLSGRQLGRSGSERFSPADYPVHKPMSSYAEALRAVRNALTLGRERPPRIVAIVSSLPGEGKTSTAAALARVMALSGDRVLLVDCDIRRSHLTRMLGIVHVVSLLDVLAGSAALEDALVPDAVDGVAVLPINQPTFSPRDLFGDGAMRQLLGRLADAHDAVILDTPPLLAVAEARTLATLADAVVMVVRADATPRDAARAALNLLRGDGAPLAGGVLSMTGAGLDPTGYHHLYRDYHEN